MLFDYDTAENAFHSKSDNPSLVEWKRKNIENYLLIPEAWKRAVLQGLKTNEENLFVHPVLQIINEFFTEQNLTLPPGKNWRNVTANIFSVVDGKRILFENNDSLFHRLRNGSIPVEIIRELIAMSMTAAEIHDDVHDFLTKLIKVTGTK